MQITTSKEKILKKVREALIQGTPQPFPQVEATTDYYPQPEQPLEVVFAEQFTKIQGKFVYCESLAEFRQNLDKIAHELAIEKVKVWDQKVLEFAERQNWGLIDGSSEMKSLEASLTRCELLVARTGSVLLSSELASGRTLSIFPPIHFILAFPDQIVFDIKDGIEILRKRYADVLPSMINLNTGPSRTADIEKTLVLGAHGPKSVFVFFVDEKL